ncbi:MAG: hypothetical protein AB7U30_13150 [Sulfuricellaceae bacterium]
MSKRRSAYDTEHLARLTVFFVLGARNDWGYPLRRLLEAAVAEVYGMPPSAWSVETLDQLLADQNRVSRLRDGLEVAVDEPLVQALRGMVAEYGGRQQQLFDYQLFTPLWPWVGLARMCNHDPAYHECPYPRCEDSLSCFAAEPVRALGQFDAKTVDETWWEVSPSTHRNSEVEL